MTREEKILKIEEVIVGSIKRNVSSDALVLLSTGYDSATSVCLALSRGIKINSLTMLTHIDKFYIESIANKYEGLLNPLYLGKDFLAEKKAAMLGSGIHRSKIATRIAQEFAIENGYKAVALFEPDVMLAARPYFLTSKAFIDLKNLDFRGCYLNLKTLVLYLASGETLVLKRPKRFLSTYKGILDECLKTSPAYHKHMHEAKERSIKLIPLFDPLMKFCYEHVDFEDMLKDGKPKILLREISKKFVPEEILALWEREPYNKKAFNDL